MTHQDFFIWEIHENEEKRGKFGSFFFKIFVNFLLYFLQIYLIEINGLVIVDVRKREMRNVLWVWGSFIYTGPPKIKELWNFIQKVIEWEGRGKKMKIDVTSFMTQPFKMKNHQENDNFDFSSIRKFDWWFVDPID